MTYNIINHMEYNGSPFILGLETNLKSLNFHIINSKATHKRNGYRGTKPRHVVTKADF